VRRSGLLLVIVFVLGLAAFLLYPRDEKLAPKPVPMGKTVTQQLPGHDGKPETWRLTKQEVPREKLPDLVLPKPAPRTRPPDERTESARALEGQALESWKHGDIAAAIGKFDAAVKADPDDAEVRSQYGRLLTLMTDYKQAYPHLERAAQLKPRDPQVWLDLATIYEKDTLLERKQYALKKAEELAPGAKYERDENGFYFLPGGKLFP
jgi:tetratricopeptide (TPR) repeat protein